MNFKEVWMLLKKDPLQRNVLWRLSILSYQLGDVIKATVYRIYYGNEGHHTELKLALADLIAQIRILTIQNGLNYDELEELGLKRLMDFVTKRMRTEVNLKKESKN